MAVRRIIKIAEDKCNGCGLCVNACHEAAIELKNGKAKLIKDEYCDGLGDCLPECPTQAISFEEREADDYNEVVVKARMAAKRQEKAGAGSGCPGGQVKAFGDQSGASELRQWPVQIKLAPVQAQFFDNAALLIAADCSAFAYADFHRQFIKDHITLIGCPKLDDINYSDKLTDILRLNNIKSITVVRMEVPCCGGIEQAVRIARENSGKMIPWQVVTVSVKGEIIK